MADMEGRMLLSRMMHSSRARDKKTHSISACSSWVWRERGTKGLL